MAIPVFRFAPSPNGRLHLGHAYSALLNDALARRSGGRFLLRIEDLDPVRSRPDLAAAIETDLLWLGLRFEAPPLRQSQRLSLYRRAIETLARQGLAYPCFCSRGAVAASVVAYEGATDRPWPRDPDGVPLYPGTCRTLAPSDVAARIAAGARHVWRLAMDGAIAAAPGPHRFATFMHEKAGPCLADPARWGDVVIGRRDVSASYHLAVVVDDEAQGITHVVRGTDLLAATDIHVLLQALFGFRTPEYHHHDLVRDEAGDKKLAKSRGSPSLADLRAEGWSPDDVRARLGLS